MSDLFYGEWTRHVSLRHKILRIEWPMVVLIAILACIGFAMLFSAAGGHLSPWANRQLFRFPPARDNDRDADKPDHQRD